VRYQHDGRILFFVFSYKKKQHKPPSKKKKKGKKPKPTGRHATASALPS
jgi:hypothetical protein